MLVSDNGASAEGGPHGSINENQFFNNVPETLEDNLARDRRARRPEVLQPLPMGLDLGREHAVPPLEAGDLPRRRLAIRFIVHWPTGSRPGARCGNQYAHVIDMVPTVLDALGIEPPKALRGRDPVTRSKASAFAHTLRRRRRTEPSTTPSTSRCSGTARSYHDGWRAVCPVPGPSFAEAGVGFGMLELTEDRLRELDANGWELYDVEQRPGRDHEPRLPSTGDQLIEMIALWYAEAGKYNVLPLDSRGTTRFADERPQLTDDRETYVYYPGTQVVPENVAVKTLNRAHRITAEVELTGRDEGVIVCHGSNIGGYTLFVQDDRLHYVHNYVGIKELVVSSERPLTEGRHSLRYEFTPTGKPDLKAGKGSPGTATLFVDDDVVGQADFEVTVPLALGIGSGIAVGRNPGSPVSQRYTTPFRFTGVIDTVTVTLISAADHDEAEVAKGHARVAMARQ